MRNALIEAAASEVRQGFDHLIEPNCGSTYVPRPPIEPDISGDQRYAEIDPAFFLAHVGLIQAALAARISQLQGVSSVLATLQTNLTR